MDSCKYLTKDGVHGLLNNSGSNIDVSDSDSEVSNNKSESNENCDTDMCEVSNILNIQHVSNRFSQNNSANLCNDQAQYSKQ